MPLAFIGEPAGIWFSSPRGSHSSSGKVTGITITEDNFMPESGQGSFDGGYTAEVPITACASGVACDFIHAKDQKLWAAGEREEPGWHAIDVPRCQQQ